MMNEESIIARLKQNFLLPGGIGDDAAVIPIDNNQSYVISKDLLVEDVHFRRSYYDPESLAHKSLHVNLSDIAAMGAKPAYVLLGISLPPNLPTGFVESFLDSFSTQCKSCDVQLIGGDTTGSTDKIFISVTVIGRGDNNSLKFRHSARIGDMIYVAGQLGEAHGGLIALEKNMAGFARLKERTLKPTARTQEGLWFGNRSEITSMMDISDGLYTDLKKLCHASSTGGDIFVDALHPNAVLQEFCQEAKIDPIECMLAGGEDYGLLITVSPEESSTLTENFSAAFNYELQPVGQITSATSVRLLKNDQEVPFTYPLFTHFGE